MEKYYYNCAHNYIIIKNGQLDVRISVSSPLDHDTPNTIYVCNDDTAFYPCNMQLLCVIHGNCTLCDETSEICIVSGTYVMWEAKGDIMLIKKED